MSYFATFEEVITKSIQIHRANNSMQNHDSNENINNNAYNKNENISQIIINNNPASNYSDFIKEILSSQHFTVFCEKLSKNIAANQASTKVLFEKINDKIQSTEEEIEAFENIIMTHIKKRDELKERLDQLQKSKMKLATGGQIDMSLIL